MMITANMYSSVSEKTYTFVLSLVVILLLTMYCLGLQAAELSGTIRSVDDRIIIIDIKPGQQPGVGDRVEVSFLVGEKKFMVGDWRVIRVSGTTVYAEEEKVKLPVDTGMQAVIFTGTATTTASSVPAEKQATVSAQNQPQPANELFWRDPDKTSPQAAAASTDELFWLQPGYRHGQNPLTTNQAVTPQPEPRAAPAVTEASVLQPLPAGTGAIQSITSRQYEMVWNDSGSGAQVDFAIFKPAASSGYYPLGYVAVAGPWRGPRYGQPSFTSIMVKDGTMALARPTGYRLIWSSRGSNSDQPFSSWEPVAPAGFQCLGDVGNASLDQKPSTDAIRCLPDSCVVQTGIGPKIWDDSGSGAARDFSAWRVPELNLYIGIAAHTRPRNMVYTINPSCL